MPISRPRTSTRGAAAQLLHRLVVEVQVLAARLLQACSEGLHAPCDRIISAKIHLVS